MAQVSTQAHLLLLDETYSGILPDLGQSWLGEAVPANIITDEARSMRFLQYLLQEVSFRDQDRFVWHYWLRYKLLAGVLKKILAIFTFIALSHGVDVDLCRRYNRCGLLHRLLHDLFSILCVV